MLLGWFRYWYFPVSQISANVTFLVSAFEKTFLLSNFLSLLTIFGIPTKDAQTESEYCIRLFTLFRLLPKEMPGFCKCPVSWIIPEFIGQFSCLRRELEAWNSIALSEMEGWHKWTFLLRRKLSCCTSFGRSWPVNWPVWTDHLYLNYSLYIWNIYTYIFKTMGRAVRSTWACQMRPNKRGDCLKPDTNFLWNIAVIHGLFFFGAHLTAWSQRK